jgi:hypothetical protein
MPLGATFIGPGQGNKKRPTKAGLPAPPAPISNVYLTFQGIGFTSGKARNFEAIVGTNPPTVTGGYAKWQTVERPLQRALTIFQGYDPVQMTVDIIFGSWANGWDTSDGPEHGTPTYGGKFVENNIAALEWMAGSNFQSGPSPVVYMWSYSSQGGQSDLIPPQYQSTQKSRYPWIITGLGWGQAYRNQNGYRVWQEATITLENYLNLNPAPAPETSGTGGFFVSKPGRDQPILIAGAPDVKSPLEDHQILAGRICEAKENNPCQHTSIRLRGKSLRFQIRHGVKVFIPGHTII